MDAREQLIELLDQSLYSASWDSNDWPCTDDMADYLIANSVKVILLLGMLNTSSLLAPHSMPLPEPPKEVDYGK